MRGSTVVASLGALLISVAPTVLAVPQQFMWIRDNTGSTDAAAPTSTGAVVTLGEPAPTPTLEPILPPESHPEDLDILTPDKKVTLFYQGKQSSKRSTDDVTVAQLGFTFKYPSIPLDHSSFVSTVTCSGNTALSATFDPTGFDYAKSSWPTKSNIILITSTQGCGPDNQNGLFLATKVTFSDADSSVSAVGSFVQVADILDTLKIDWGNVSPTTSDQSTPTDYGCSTCGPDFDKNVDAGLGYYTGDRKTVLAQFAPGANLSNIDKRDFLDDVGDFIGDVADGVGDVISDVGDGIADIGKTIVEGAGGLIDTIGTIAGDLLQALKDIASGEYSRSATVDIDIFAHYLNDINPISGEGEDDGEEPPWENAYLLVSWDGEKAEGENKGGEDKSSETRSLQNVPALRERELTKAVNVYCVDCGIKGSVTATGSIGLSITEGITDCSVGIHGNLEAGLFLGLQMYMAYEKSYEMAEFKRSLLGWEIPGIILFGPYASIGAETKVEVKAEGTVLLGAKAEWSAFEATLDMFHPSESHQSGWVPEVTKKFEPKGKLSVEASLGLPVAVGIGLDLLGGTWEAGVELRDTPAIVAEGEFEISYSANQTTSSDGTSTSGSELDINGGCYGIAWNIHLENELAVKVTGLDEFELDKWEGEPLAEGCIGYKVDDEGDGNNSTDTDTNTTPPSGNNSTDTDTTPPTDNGSTGTNGTDTSTPPADNGSSGTNGTDTTTPPTDNGSGGSNGTDTTTPPDHGSTCTVTPVQSDSYSCGTAHGRAIGNAHILGRRLRVKDEEQCMVYCSRSKSCRGFAYIPGVSGCQLFKRKPEKIRFSAGNDRKVYDARCFTVQNCKEVRDEAQSLDIFPRASNPVTAASITDSSGAFKLVPGADGNIEIAFANDTSTSTVFASMAGLIVGDSTARLLHYYPGSVASTGASRLRLAAVDHLPKTSAFITLAPVDTGDVDVLVAVDTKDNTFYPIVCEIKDLGNKLFLVDNLSKANDELMAQAVRGSITGGYVERCAPLMLTIA